MVIHTGEVRAQFQLEEKDLLTNIVLARRRPITLGPASL